MPDAKQWEEALRTKMKQQEGLGVFSASCELPYEANTFNTRAIFKKKRTKTGAVEHWKVRLWVERLLQTFGVDFFDTNKPVARIPSFRIIYPLSVYPNLFIENTDMDATFLNAMLNEDIYIDPLDGHPSAVKARKGF